MGLFGKTPQRDPKELVREWSAKMRKEGRVLDRQIRSIQREEEKVKRSLKQAAKKNDPDVCKILAKEIIQSRRAIGRIYTAKANINSIEMTMKNQAAMVRVSGAMEKSSEVMKAMQALIKVPEVQQTMQDLSKEMMKAGIIEEMMEDAFDDATGEEEDEATQEEIDKILSEITTGALRQAPDKVTDALPEIAGPSHVEEEEDSDEEREMQQRLEALRS